MQSLLDADGHGIGWRGLAVRAGLLASGLSYGALALYALGLAGIVGPGPGPGSGEGEGGSQAASMLVALTGSWAGTIILSLVFAAIALAHGWKALTAGYTKYVHPPRRYRHAVHLVSVGGLLARGAVFAVIAFLLWARRLDYGARDMPDTETVLTWTGNLPWGGVVLAGLGAGLILFCLYSFAEAVWREVRLPSA